MLVLPLPAFADDPPDPAALPVLAIEADPDGACPAGVPPYDAWCIGIGGGLTELDGTPLPPDAIRVAVSSVLGRNVVAPDKSPIGRVVDVLVDGEGRALAAVIDFGGFMGLGSRKVAVNWALMQFPAPGSDDDIVLQMSDSAITSTPAYVGGTGEAIVLGPAPLDRPTEVKLAELKDAGKPPAAVTPPDVATPDLPVPGTPSPPEVTPLLPADTPAGGKPKGGP